MTSPTAVLVSTQKAWHGGEAQALLLACGLRRRGWSVRMLARRGGAFAVRMAREGFEVATFPGRGRMPTAIWQNRRRLHAWQPDLLLYNDAHAVTAGGVASLALQVPARLALRRVDFPVRNTSRYHHYCDRIVCVSRGVARVCRQSGIDASRIRVVHDGVDPARVRAGERQRGRKALGLKDSTPLLLCVAKLTDHKGHRYLLDAMPAVLAARPGVVLALAGDGELTSQLQQQAKRLGVEEQVRFLGFRSDVPDLIMASDVFVMASHMEGLCTSLIDAMLAGRPIVTTTAGGISDLVGFDAGADGPVAHLVAPRQPEALATAILDVLDRPHRAAALARHALRRAEQCFTAECMLAGTLGVYEEIVGQQQQAAA